MASVFDRLERERAVVKEELAALGNQLDAIHRRVDAAEALLRDLDTAQRILESLPEDESEEPEEPEAPPAAEFGGPPQEDPGESDEPSSGSDSGPAGSKPPLEWEEGRRRMLSVLTTAGRPMKAKPIAAAIGEDVSTPARVETTRARLKTLVKEGLVVEDAESQFAIATAETAAADEGAPGAS